MMPTFISEPFIGPIDIVIRLYEGERNAGKTRYRKKGRPGSKGKEA